jgi:hypothetical protein
LETLGVTEIGTDHLRQVGRGVRQRQPSIDQLYGHCARGKIAVSPNGDVWPCVFCGGCLWAISGAGRWLKSLPHHVTGSPSPDLGAVAPGHCFR